MNLLKNNMTLSVCRKNAALRAVLFLAVCSAAAVPLEAQTAAATALDAAAAAVKCATALDSVDYLKKTAASLTVPAEKRSLYAYVGALQEQLGLYSDACVSYASAAAIAAGDAPGMPKKSSEQLVLDAVRVSLSTGDYDTADRYLNSAVRNSKDADIQAYIKLYAQWSALCRAETAADTKEPLMLLDTYTQLDSMKPVRPALYLTLWYLTGKNDYAEKLQHEYAGTPEAAVVSGRAQMMPAPFWYFVPHEGAAAAVPLNEPAAVPAEKADTAVSSAAGTVPDSKNGTEDTASADGSTAPDRARCQQLGLFREKANADALVESLSKKGFSARITSEKRASGTTYYIVVVDEDAAGSMGAKLKDAGFECYPVFN